MHRLALTVVVMTAFVARAAAEDCGPPSQTFERALALYRKKDFLSASILLKKVVERETGDDECNADRAQFFLGKTLFQLQLYAGSLRSFNDLAARGPAHDYYAPTMKWLSALGQIAP